MILEGLGATAPAPKAPPTPPTSTPRLPRGVNLIVPGAITLLVNRKAHPVIWTIGAGLLAVNAIALAVSLRKPTP